MGRCADRSRIQSIAAERIAEGKAFGIR